MPVDGLHILKDELTQKSDLGKHSQWVADNLEAIIQATDAAAHIRTQGFRLNRPMNEEINPRSAERRLEAAILRRWNQPEMWGIPDGWDRLVAFQVPLYAQADQEQWGDIDLLGVNAKGLPVVVELKKAPKVLKDGKTVSSETPLRMALEAASYAIALRKNWSTFRLEWIDRLRALKLSDQVIESVPEELRTVPLVAAAPASFWIDWIPITAKGRTVSLETWGSFKILLELLRQKGLPISFVSISGSDGNFDELGVQPLRFPLTLP